MIAIEKTEGKTLEKMLAKVSNALMYVSAGALLIMLLLGTVDVLGRYIFNSPIVGGAEMSQIMLAAIIFFGWPLVQLGSKHIRASVVIDRMPKKTRTIIGIITTVFAIALFVLMIWQGLLNASNSNDAGRMVYVINIPIAPLQLMAPMGAFFVSLVLILQLFQLVTELRRRS